MVQVWDMEHKQNGWLSNFQSTNESTKSSPWCRTVTTYIQLPIALPPGGEKKTIKLLLLV
jgi:hypothetical protein